MGPWENLEITNLKRRYHYSESYLKKAEKVIPLGSQTFSKSRTQYPFGVSPYFATHAKGAYVYDVDGNKYLDFVNSLAAITLGYQDPDVLEAVKKQLDKGSIFTLSSPLECQVAEKIIDMVPCAEMLRFGKNGTDTTSAAIRLARAYTNREHIAVCGYHGWQDWYIGSTTRHLGVPKATQALTHTFRYNNLSSLETLFDQYPNKVAAVIMEPVNAVCPKDGYLKSVQTLAKKNGAVFIFDETITGFRFANGGAQEFFGITPDLACFGKGLANGYPLSAVVGKKDIMQKMEDIFFSGTFGGETLSLAAADAVLNKLQTEPVIKTLWSLGEGLQNKLNQLIQSEGLTKIFNVSGYPVWSFFNIKDTSFATSYELKTLMLQSMFENNILNLGTHNLSFAHTQGDINQLIEGYNIFFEKVKIAQKNGIEELIRCDVLEPLFKVRT